MLKRPKRFQATSDDEQDRPHSSVSEKNKKRRASEAGTSVPLEGDDGSQDDADDEPNKVASTTGRKGRANVDGPRSRKKQRKILQSDPESEEDYLHEIDMPFENVSGNDDHLSQEEKSTKVANKNGKAPTKVPGKGGKRKAKGDAHQMKKSSTIADHKRAKASQKPDEVMIDVVGNATPTPPLQAPVIAGISPSTEKSEPAQAIPVKKKLPTIKKTKLPGSSSTPTAASSSIPPLEIGANKLNQDGIRKTLIGATDIDLSNKSIYQEIFLKTGVHEGGSIRTGLNRQEERRKELNKMRDEAKAKRAMDLVYSFDLQAQFDKISRFEEKLKVGRSLALYPNFLAAKWREHHEIEKRKQKAEYQESVYTNGKEEGEVS